MPGKEPERKDDINLTGFTLSGGDGKLYLGLTDDTYVLGDRVISKIQKEAEKKEYDVTLNADVTDKVQLTLVTGETTQAINRLICFIVKTILDSGYRKRVAA